MTEEAKEPAHYTKMYAILVTPDEGIAGMIAYALYKENKREWIIQFERKHGRRPTADEVKQHVDGITSLDIECYRLQAREQLSTFSLTFLQANIEK